MKDLIIKYLKLSIECKKSLKKEIKEIHNILNTLAQAQAYQMTILNEYKDMSYKTKFLNEHKKYKEVEKQIKESKEIIDELTNELKIAYKKEVKS